MNPYESPRPIEELPRPFWLGEALSNDYFVGTVWGILSVLNFGLMIHVELEEKYLTAVFFAAYSIANATVSFVFLTKPH